MKNLLRIFLKGVRHSKVFIAIFTLMIVMVFAINRSHFTGEEIPTLAENTNETEAELDGPIKDKRKNPLKKITQPVKKAVTKTAEMATQEVKAMAKGAHTLGGKVLQGIINIMIAASPGKTRVYLPAPSSDPNTGLTVGILPVFLFVDKEEVIRHIIAPSLTYNKFFGVNATNRYYFYPKPGAQLFTIQSFSEETNKRITVRYEDPEFIRKWFYFKTDITVWKDGSHRFFGLGPSSPFESQTNYTLNDKSLVLLTGINFKRYFRFTLGHRFRQTDATDGPIDSLPGISSRFATTAGVNNESNIMSQKLSFSIDTRDSTLAPTKGHRLNLFGEFAGRIGGDHTYERFGGDLRGFYGKRKNRFVTGWRVLYEGLDSGDDLPFYERSLLGGKSSLRGFGDARFVDRYKFSFTIEERIIVYTLNAFNVNIDFEVTPFYETGTVFRNKHSLRGSELHHVGGVGFRSVVRPNVVGIIDIAFGDEGTALYVGIDYPF